MILVLWQFCGIKPPEDRKNTLACIEQDFLIDAIFEQPQALEAFPYSGRVVPKLNLPSLRELIIHKYRVVYSVPDKSQVHILTVRPSSFPLGEVPIEGAD